MGGTISLKNCVVGVKPATATGEGEVGAAEICTVKHDDCVVT